MGKSIWVIEDGCYSDYQVVGVYSTKANADFMRDKIGGSVAEWSLDPAVEELHKGYSVYLGEMLYDGTTKRMQEAEICSYNISCNTHIWGRSTVPFYKGQNIQDCLHGTVLAKDKKHAIKIFNERRVQLIASGEFKPPKDRVI